MIRRRFLSSVSAAALLAALPLPVVMGRAAKAVAWPCFSGIQWINLESVAGIVTTWESYNGEDWVLVDPPNIVYDPCPAPDTSGAEYCLSLARCGS